jgi:hypothetical protein
LFALALPGLVAGSFTAWIGEVARMRRAASFLRDIEFTAYKALGPGMPPTPTYDNVVARGPAGTGNSVTRTGRRAVAALHLALFVGSIAVASASVWNLEPQAVPVCLRVIGQAVLAGGVVAFGWGIHVCFRDFVAPYGDLTPSLLDGAHFEEIFTDMDSKEPAPVDAQSQKR